MLMTRPDARRSLRCRPVLTALCMAAAFAGSLVFLTADGFAADNANTPAGQALRARAIKACNGPQYPSGATPRINYTKGTFQCIEPGSTRH